MKLPLPKFSICLTFLLLLCGTTQHLRAQGGQRVSTEAEASNVEPPSQGALGKQSLGPSIRMEIAADAPKLLVGLQGINAYIPANAFVFSDGSPVKGEVDIQITEVTRKDDLIMAHLPTVSNGQMLVSAGVVHLEAFADGKALQLAEGKDILIQFPGGAEQGMELFSGEMDANGNMNWNPMPSKAKNPAERPTPSALKALNGSAKLVPPFTAYGKADPKTFIFQDKKHTVHGYLYEQLKKNYPCAGNDAVYVEVVFDWQGYTLNVKTLTGNRACYKAAVIEVLSSIQWDPKTVVGTSNRTIYFEVKPIIPMTKNPGENVFVSIADNPNVSLDENTRKAYREQAEKYREANLLASFSEEAFATTQLGWINCDRFYDAKEQVEVVVKVDKGSIANPAECVLAFASMNSMLRGIPQPDGTWKFAGIPPGLKANIVSFVYDKEAGPHLAILPITTHAGDAGRLSLRAVSQTEFKAALGSL